MSVLPVAALSVESEASGSPTCSDWVREAPLSSFGANTVLPNNNAPAITTTVATTARAQMGSFFLSGLRTGIKGSGTAREPFSGTALLSWVQKPAEPGKAPEFPKAVSGLTGLGFSGAALELPMTGFGISGAGVELSVIGAEIGAGFPAEAPVFCSVFA